MDLLKVETVNQCIDFATTDACGDDEIAGAWQTCLEEIFEKAEVELAGQKVKLVDFEIVGDAVLAVCQWKKRKLRVTLGSLDFPRPTPAQKLWRKAYLKWQKESWGHYA